MADTPSSGLDEPAAETAPGPDTGAAYRALLVFFGVSSFGSGMVLPLTAVYITAQLGLGASVAGRYYVLIAVATFALTLAGGRLTDRWRPATVAACGLSLLTAAYVLLSLAGSALSVTLCAVVVGAGNALVYPSLAPAIGAVVPEEQRRRAFSQRYTAMNVGIGLGAAVGGAVIGQVHGLTGYRVLYLADSATFLPLALALLRIRPPERTAGQDAGDDSPPQDQPAGGYRTLLRSRPILLLTLVQCAATLFGYAQFETAAPLLIHRAMAGDLWLLGTVVAVNTAAVVLLQSPLRRWFSRRTESSALLVGGLFWAGAYGCGALAAAVPGTAGPPAMIAFAVLFAVGESAYACSFYPLMLGLAPDGLLGRVSGLTSMGANVGSTVGPAVGVALATALDVRAGWAVLAAGALLFAGTALALDRAVRSDAAVTKDGHD
ncbi:MFS transporter [Streptomyces sp. NPDC005423]|uniref:MFS transporter n=1 Tax=Streptomyces sp. NPDC005423 TaxID=3155343 RepID=UPI0033B45C8D